MTVSFESQEQNAAAVNQNLLNKGFRESPPTVGCTYVVQPPKEYQELFQDLQDTLSAAEAPFANVRIPHATVIAAKVVDQGPQDQWESLEEVQKIYRGFFLNSVDLFMEKFEYREAVLKALQMHEGILANIAKATSGKEALSAIEDKNLYSLLQKEVAEPQKSDACHQIVKQKALCEISKAAFQLKVASVNLTNNGSITFQLSKDERLLHLRLDLILAGQGIAKWPALSKMQHAWSTVAYTTQVLTISEKAEVDAVVKEWVDNNQSQLQRVAVDFDSEHLSALAFRSNDFFAVKRASFPVVKSKQPTLLSEEDLRMTPRAGRKGIEPISGNRAVPRLKKEDWNYSMDQEIFALQAPNS